MSNPLTDVKYPRLIRRVRAVLIDSMLAILIVFTWWLSLPLLGSYPVAVRVAYPIVAWLILDPMLVSLVGASPGHYLMKLSVQSASSGRRIGILRAITRSLIKMLTGWDPPPGIRV